MLNTLYIFVQVIYVPPCVVSQDLPTIGELTKPDSLRRLRDKLISSERLGLAMDVSTKCGIDPAGVWSAMGFACLHTGDFAGARDKFAHILKVRDTYVDNYSVCL